MHPLFTHLGTKTDMITQSFNTRPGIQAFNAALSICTKADSTFSELKSALISLEQVYQEVLKHHPIESFESARLRSQYAFIKIHTVTSWL